MRDESPDQLPLPEVDAHRSTAAMAEKLARADRLGINIRTRPPLIAEARKEKRQPAYEALLSKQANEMAELEDLRKEIREWMSK